MTRRRLLASVATGAVVVAAFAGFLPRIADLGEVWGVVRSLSPAWVASLTALALLNLATYPWLSMASLPGLRFGPAVVVTQTSTAVANTVPAGAGVGIAVTYAMYDRYRLDRTAIALSITSTGLANTAVRLAMPLLAAVWLGVVGDAPSWAWRAARIGAAATVVVALAVWLVVTRPLLVRGAARVVARVRRRDADSAGRWAARRLALLRRDAAALSGSRGWLVLGTAVASHLALYALFLGCLAATGVDVAPSVAFAVFAAVRLGLSVPVTPGGVGIAEAGYAAALSAAGAPGAPAVAAVLLFRAASYLLPIPVGLACWLATRTGRKARAPRVHAPCPAPAPRGTVEGRATVPYDRGGGELP
ncbi:MAG TPA: lysylphosphatidylglycerol synthase domain-containing protein [Frankiaceae bacterium]|nr:lysylphosphatidylglycerol synthase domain-containing protein [Frankiaceae bacterium]